MRITIFSSNIISQFQTIYFSTFSKLMFLEIKSREQFNNILKIRDLAYTTHTLFVNYFQITRHTS